MPVNHHHTKRYVATAKGHPNQWVPWNRTTSTERILTVLAELGENTLAYDIMPDPIKGAPYYNIMYMPATTATTKATTWNLSVTITEQNTCILTDEVLDITIEAKRLSDAVLLYADAIIPKPKADDILDAIMRNEEAG